MALPSTIALSSTTALPPVGAQLMVLGGHRAIKYDMETQRDLVLDSLAASGYAGVEGGPRDAASYKDALDARGLRYGGSHVSLGVLADDTKIAGLIDSLHTLGGRDICNSGLRHWNERSAADYHDAAAVLNGAGQRFRDAGVTLHYHHHDFEFEKVEGSKTGLDILLGETDPALVELCVDIAWVQKGGGDPGEFLMQHQDRVSYLHFKDYTAEGDWAELGRGVVNIGGVMEALPNLPRIRWVMAEQDKTTRDPLESLAMSRRYLREAFGY